MTKRIIFFDGDGTLWYPERTRRSRKPFWVYTDPETNGNYLHHLILTPEAAQTLRKLRADGMQTVLLSTHPHEPEEAAAILAEKVEYFSLGELFDEIHATREYPAAKGEKILEILRQRQLPPETALMVGDSYRWDYLAATNVGVQAVLIDSQYHQESLAEEPCELLISELDQLPALLTKLSH